jgi:hypothetical protein
MDFTNLRNSVGKNATSSDVDVSGTLPEKEGQGKRGQYWKWTTHSNSVGDAVDIGKGSDVSRNPC